MSGVSMNPATTRTVMLHTLPLTVEKQSELRDLVHAYTKAKDRFLLQLHSRAMWRYLDDKRGLRDAMKAAGNYPIGVHVHLSDQAAFDAIDTMVRHIESVITGANVRANIWRRNSALKRRFAYTCLKRYEWMANILMGRNPAIESSAFCGLDDKGRDPVAKYLHRVLRKAFSRTRLPRTCLKRTMALDDTLYSVFTVTNIPTGHSCDNSSRRCRQKHVCQSVSVVGTRPNKRIVLPLAGVSKTARNICIVRDQDTDRAVIHVPYAIEPLKGGVRPTGSYRLGSHQGAHRLRWHEAWPRTREDAW